MPPRDPWAGWGQRLRAHVKEKRIPWEKVAARVGESGVAISTVRSWLNGTRDINLVDFFALCKAAEADPAAILFGVSSLTPEQRQLLRRFGEVFP